MPDFPRIATPAEIWAYSPRELTAFVGAPRTDLVGVNEAIYTRLDTTVSSRSSHSAVDVWTTVTTRELTAIKGTPREDLIGQDAAIPATTVARIAALDRLPNIEAFDAPIEGVVTFAAAATYPLTIDLITSEIGVKHIVEGFIDLSELASGEDLKIREEMSLVTPVDYKAYAEETYSGVQTLELLNVATKPAKDGLRIRASMDTAPAADRAFRYQFFRKRVA